jgi:hypothetical protein
MSNILIAQELEMLIEYSKQLDNVYLNKRLNNLKELLSNEWSESELYYDILKMDDTLEMLNELTIR